MFCFSSQRKNRGDRLASDFSQSASALNHLTVPGSPDCIVNMCHSDSNISNISLLKSAVKIKSMLSGSRSKKNISASTPPSLSAECVVVEESGSVIETQPAFQVKADICFIDGEPSSLSSSRHSINLVPQPKTRPQNIVVEADSSSGNSSSADDIAPMASPEKTPPESGVSSPTHFEPPDLSPCLRVRYQLVNEADVQVCKLNHTRTIVSKVLSSKFLRRWEMHHIHLGDTHISSRTVNILVFSQF